MFCSTCGQETTPGVNFCKRCGSILNVQSSLQTRVISMTGPSWALSVVIIFMLGIIFGGVIKLAELGVSSAALAWMVIFGSGTVIALSSMIIRLWHRIMESKLQNSLTIQQSANVTNELNPHHPNALPDHIPSVTEHTTRVFEPAYRETINRKE